MIHFQTASEQAIVAFEQSSSFDKKVIATKLRILTILHINRYFNHESRNLSLIRDLVTIIWNDFLTLAEVRSSLRDEFEKSIIFRIIGTKDGRKDVLFEISTIKAIVDDILGTSAPIRLPSKATQVDLYRAKAVIIPAHSNAIQAMIISGGVLYTGSADCFIKAWDVSSSSFSLIRTYQGHRGDIRCLLVHEGNLYSAAGDRSIIGWNISDDSNPIISPKISFPIEHTDSVNSLLVHQDRLFSASHDSDIRVWDLATATCLATLKAHQGWVFQLVKHKNRMFSSSRDHTIAVWELSDQEIPTSPIMVMQGWKCCIYSMLVYDGFLFGGAYDHTIKVWDLNTESINLDPIKVLRGHKGWVLSLTSSPGRLYSGSGDQSFCVWDISGDTLSKPDSPYAAFKAHKGPVLQVIASHGRLFSSSTENDYQMRLI
jgi:hypothetical protein